MQKIASYKKALQHAMARLESISSPSDIWAFFVRVLAFTIGRAFNLEKLRLYDTKQTGMFAYRKLAPYFDGEKYDFNGIYLPLPPFENDYGNLAELYSCFKDVLGVYLHNNDDYFWKYVDKLEKRLVEGVYCYHNAEEGIKILINKDDVVLDLGAWIGDFSAYASKKGAIVYAFEPLRETRVLLEKTVEYNKGNGGEIHIVPYGVGSENASVTFYRYGGHAASSTFIEANAFGCTDMERVDVVKLDDWAQQENIKINFIKADIEGFERNMLKGAANILKTQQPILSLCTYHYPDDPAVMEKLILEANPNYRIIQRQMKLFAYVPCKLKS